MPRLDFGSFFSTNVICNHYGQITEQYLSWKTIVTISLIYILETLETLLKPDGNH